MKTTSTYIFTTAALMMVYFCAGASIPEKPEVKLDSNGRCVEKATWMNDCNQCFCEENGAPACTLKGCIHLPLVEIKEIELKEETSGPTEEKCVPGTTWKADCNSCFCTESGLRSCTKRGCVQLVKEQN